MKLTKALTSVFNIKKGEGRSIGLLMGFSFFMGAAMAFFYTAATTLLLAGFETTILPWVYILSGILGYVIWYFSSRLEKRFSFISLMRIYLGFLTITVLMYAVALYIYDTPWIAFMMFIWIRVFLFITAVVFWGVSARLFNLRQGKRLFGLISSGEVMSNIIGFLSIPILMRFIITSDLVVIAFVSLAFCFLFLTLIIKRFKDRLQEKKSATVIDDKSKRHKGEGIYKSKYFRLLFIMALLPMFSIYFVDYIFLDETKSEFPDREVLASFLGLFLGFVAIAEFIIKTFLSGRLISKYGLKVGLTALPFLMILSTFLASLSGTLYGTTAMFFSFVLMTKLFERAIRSSLNDPSYQILYQPLPPEDRLYYQSRIEGIPKAMGNTIAGLVLLALTSISFVNLVYFNYVFLIILLFWIKKALDQYREYRSTLQDVIRKEDVSDQSHEDNDNVSIFTRGILNSPKQYFSSLFKLTENSEAAYTKKIIKNVLTKSSQKNKKELLDEIKKEKLVQAIDIIDDIIDNGEAGDIKTDMDETSAFLKSVENIRFEDLAALSKSDDPDERMFAVKLLERSGRYNTFRLLLDLLQDKDIKVRKASIIASGRIKRHELWSRIIDHLSFPNYSNEAFTAIEEIGQPILHELDSYFGKLSENKSTQLRIIKLFERIGGYEAKQYLKSRINHHDRDIRYQVLLSLSTLEYQALPLEAASIKQSIIEEIEIIIWILAAVNDIKYSDDTSELKEALEYEFQKKREDIFLLLSLIYDPKTIKHVREKLESMDNDSRVYALEIIDMIVSDDLKPMLIPVFDDLTEREMLQHYTHIFPQEKLDLPERLKDIINKDYSKINTWTKACALELMFKYPCTDAEMQYGANIINPNKIIMEIAARNLFNVNMEKYLDLSVKLDKSNRDKLGRITKLLQQNKVEWHNLIIDKVRFLKNMLLFNDIPHNDLIDPADNLKEVEIDKGEELSFNLKDQKLMIKLKGDFAVSSLNKESIPLNDKSIIAEIIPEIMKQETIIIKSNEKSLFFELDINILYSLMSEHPSISQQVINLYYS